MELSNSLTVSLVWRNKKCFNKVKRCETYLQLEFPTSLGDIRDNLGGLPSQVRNSRKRKRRSAQTGNNKQTRSTYASICENTDVCSMCIWCTLNWSLHQTKFYVHMFPDIHSKTSQLPRNISLFSTPLPFIHWFQRQKKRLQIITSYRSCVCLECLRCKPQCFTMAKHHRKCRMMLGFGYTFFAGTISIKYSNMCASGMENIHQFFIHTFGGSKVSISFQWKQLELVDFQTVFSGQTAATVWHCLPLLYW